MVVVTHDKIKSQPCKTIYYTHGERMERLRCCEWPKLDSPNSLNFGVKSVQGTSQL